MNELNWMILILLRCCGDVEVCIQARTILEIIKHHILHFWEELLAENKKTDSIYD
jgi:hypothetical protein